MHACLKSQEGAAAGVLLLSISYRLRTGIPGSWSPIPISSISSSARARQDVVSVF